MNEDLSNSKLVRCSEPTWFMGIDMWVNDAYQAVVICNVLAGYEVET